MVCQVKSVDTSNEAASAVLMARLVDRIGAEIRPSHIASLRYSLYHADPYWPEQLTVVRGHRHVRLNVREVLFDELQSGLPWCFDDIGYNFRHAFALERNNEKRTPRLQYELRYEFEITGGVTTTVRFGLRC